MSIHRFIFSFKFFSLILALLVSLPSKVCWAYSPLENAASLYLGIEPNSDQKWHPLTAEWKNFVTTQLSVSPVLCYEETSRGIDRSKPYNVDFRFFTQQSTLREVRFSWTTQFYFRTFYIENSRSVFDELYVGIDTSMQFQSNPKARSIYPFPTKEKPYSYTSVFINKKGPNGIKLQCLPVQDLQIR